MPIKNPQTASDYTYNAVEQITKNKPDPVFTIKEVKPVFLKLCDHRLSERDVEYTIIKDSEYLPAQKAYGGSSGKNYYKRFAHGKYRFVK
ncbi:MAG: hypothetical protein OXH39_12890 [Candidatus Poribacteria bacterium]|nr:hypothetical protein [Candidatus Poribacteria bacterium]